MESIRVRDRIGRLLTAAVRPAGYFAIFGPTIALAVVSLFLAIIDLRPRTDGLGSGLGSSRMAFGILAIAWLVGTIPSFLTGFVLALATRRGSTRIATCIKAFALGTTTVLLLTFGMFGSRVITDTTFSLPLALAGGIAASLCAAIFYRQLRPPRY